MVKKVDSGEFVIDHDNLINPATIIRMINENREYSNEVKLERGLKLFKMINARINEILVQNESSDNDLTEGIDLYNSYLISEASVFKKEIDSAKEDYEKYLQDKEDRKEIELVKLFNCEKKEYDLVEGFFFTDVPRCKLHKDWARSDSEAKNGKGYVLTFIPVKESKIELIDKHIFYASKERGAFKTFDNFRAFEEKKSKDERDEILKSASKEFNIKINKILEKRNLINEKQLENKNKRYRIIIAVKPDSPYHLKGLGKDIEILEQKKEKKLFKNDGLEKYFRRDYFTTNGKKYEVPRFNDSWVTSSDPWYDGRDKDYTIVDAPRRGTYLTYQEIKNAFNKLNHIDIKENSVKVLIPITFNNKKYTYDKNFKKIIKEIRDLEKKYSNEIKMKNINFGSCDSEKEGEYNKSFCKLDTYIDNEVKNKFLPSIKKYMLEPESEDRNFTYYGEITFRNFKEEFSDKFTELIFPDTGREDKIKINFADDFSPNIYIFRYGVAFITFDFSYNISGSNNPNQSIEFNKILETNKALGQRIKSEVEKSLAFVFDELNFTTNLLDPVFYQFLVMDEYRLLNHSKDSIIYNLTNLLDDFDVDYESSIIKTLTDDISIELNNEVFYGFGKFGGCLISSDNFYYSNFKKNNVPPKEDFLGRDFIIFLLTLHQRIFLINFSDNIDYEDPFYLEKMRANYIDFMKSGWFSEIHKEEIANKIFYSWKKIFKTDELFLEVQEQLNGVNDYRNSVLDKKINRLTILFIPITLIAALFDSYLIFVMENDTVSDNLEGFNGLIPLTKSGLIGLIIFTIIGVSLLVGYDRIKFYLRRNFKDNKKIEENNG